MQSKIDKSVFDKGMKYHFRIPKDVPEAKFWNQRYYYYSKFDEGIKMDHESWYSVTPEDLAFYCAKIAGKDSICIDPFAGSGGNVIQFSKNCSKVFAVDIDPIKVDICKNNSEVYKCPDNIEIYLSDFLKLEKNLKADFIFLSPPWGGLEYKNSRNYSLKKMVTPDIHKIIKKSLSYGKNIMFYLPRLIDVNELFEILHDVTGQDLIFLDIHILESANKIKAILLLFGPNEAYISKVNIQNFIKMITEQNQDDSDFKELILMTRKNSDEYLKKDPDPSTNLNFEDYKLTLYDNSEDLKNLFSEDSPKTKLKDPHKILYKIYQVIGYRKFFEALIKFKEKHENKSLKNSVKNYIPSKENIPQLISFLLNEVLTDKQKTRINI